MNSRVGRTYSARFATALALAIASAMFVASSAFAASTYFEQAPEVGGVSTVAMPRISVKVSDPAGISTGFQLKIDGVTKTPKVKWGPNNSYVELYFQPTTPLPNGRHTVYASVFTGAGRTSTTWTFTQQVAPALGPMSPADGSVVDTQTPTISAVIGTNGSALSSYTMLVDGVAVVPTYNSATRTVSYKPTAKLSNNRGHSVQLRVEDASGAWSEVGWGFGVRTYVTMVDTGGCTQCHSAYPSAHPMANCDGCHAGEGPFPAYWNMENPEQYAHASDYLDGIDCTYCHASVFGTVPSHPANIADVHEVDTDMSGCPCHVGDLTTEHSRYTTNEGGAISCASCHASADPQIQAGMAIGSRVCSNCHTVPVEHLYEAHDHVADIADTLDASGKKCGDCHDMDLTVEHEKITASSMSIRCYTCHDTPADTIDTWDQACVQGGCHVAGSSTEMHAKQAAAHAQPAESSCDLSGCHTGSVDALHANATKEVDGQELTACNVCHDGSEPTKDCAACHGSAPHGDVEAMHQSNVETGTVPMHNSRALQVDCTTCHSLSLLVIHKTDCQMCHASARTAVKAALASWNGTCEACHATFHPEAAPAHQALYSFYGTSCNRDCHGMGGTDGNYRKTIEGCLLNCHTSSIGTAQEPPTWTTAGGLRVHQRYRTRISGGSWPYYTRPDQPFLVPAGVSSIWIDMYAGDGSQGGMPPLEAPGGLGGRINGRIPVTPQSLLYVRVGESAARPHEQWRWSAIWPGWPNGGSGQGASASPYTDGTNGAGSGGGSTLLKLDSQILVEVGGGGGGGGGAPGTVGGAGGVPSFGIGGAQSGGNGSMSVPYGGGGGGGWTGGAGGAAGKGGGGGTSYCFAGDVTYTAGAGRPSGKFDYPVDISWADDAAPMTTANVSDSFIGDAVIDFTASDDGGSNIAFTCYRLDKGPLVLGTTVTIPATAAKTRHTLSWYSVDNAGNIEDMRTATFTVE